jgi:hypothetical protein
VLVALTQQVQEAQHRLLKHIARVGEAMDVRKITKRTPCRPFQSIIGGARPIFFGDRIAGVQASKTGL